MRRLALPAFRRIEADGHAPAAAQPRTRISDTRPDLFVEPGEDQPVGRLQSRFELAPQEDVVPATPGYRHLAAEHQAGQHAIEMQGGKAGPGVALCDRSRPGEKFRLAEQRRGITTAQAAKRTSKSKSQP